MTAMAMEDYLKEKKAYFLARDTVQLLEVDTVSMSVHKTRPLADEKKKLRLSIEKTVVREEEETDTVKGTVEASIEVLDEKDETCAVIEVFQMGIFRAEEKIAMEDFYRRVDVQLVPQILPYLRSTVSILAVESGLAPIVIPTMDVLKSIRENSKTASKEA